MKKQVCFVFPRTNYRYAQTPYPPLGIAYLSAMIKDLCEIQLIDGQILSQDQYEQALVQIDTPLVLISASLRQLNEGLKVASLVKAKRANTRVIMGGPAFGTLPTEELIAQSPVDVVVIGEAERVIRTLVQCVTNDDISNQIGSLGEVRKVGACLEINTSKSKPNVNQLPFPDWEIYDISRYFSSWKQALGLTSLYIMGSRGCPFNCSFCDKTVTGRLYRARNPEEVVREMSVLNTTFAPDEIFYDDDLFTINEKRVLQLTEEIAANLPGIRWSAQARVDTVTRPMLEAMFAAGCTELFFGVESGSQRVLDFFNKGITPSQICAAFDLCHSVGINPGAYVIVGVPGETDAEIDETIHLLERIKPGMINLSILTPFPGTVLYQVTKGLITNHNFTQWDDFSSTVYRADCFETDPVVSRNRIEQAHFRLLGNGVTPLDWYARLKPILS